MLLQTIINKLYYNFSLITVFHDHHFWVAILILHVLQKTSKASGKNGKCTSDRLKRDIGEFVINLLITN